MDCFTPQIMHKRIIQRNAPMHQTLSSEQQNAAMHEETRRIIREMIAAHNLKSERQLAIDACVTQSTFNRFMRGETDSLDFVNLQKIARYFSLTVSELIGETSITSDPKIRAVAAAMQNMPEYKKDVLVATSSTLAQPDQATGGGKR